MTDEENQLANELLDIARQAMLAWERVTGSAEYQTVDAITEALTVWR